MWWFKILILSIYYLKEIAIFILTSPSSNANSDASFSTGFSGVKDVSGHPEALVFSSAWISLTTLVKFIISNHKDNFIVFYFFNLN